jgi:hypothetical protein
MRTTKEETKVHLGIGVCQMSSTKTDFCVSFMRCLVKVKRNNRNRVKEKTSLLPEFWVRVLGRLGRRLSSSSEGKTKRVIRCSE